MDRADLVRLLDRYRDRHPDEFETIDRIRRLLRDYEHCFHRDCFPGHITSSAWIVSRESGDVLLTHHRKLERWLQLGGHTEGEPDVLSSAVREAEEESGLRIFQAIPRTGPCEILDVDVHDIPARGSEPLHQHHDIRFLLEVSEAQTIRHQEAESKQVSWFSEAQTETRLDEESLLRMARKASDWLSRSPAGPL
jgi:8-oxo-dGTP pyrophosphatase MutT (NUDIX family)